jgi:hypothetical protein
MTYVSWALYVEGPTDRSYLGVILPRLISYLLISANGPVATVPDNPVEVFGIPKDKLDSIAELICAGKEAFHLVFVHGDLGGRGISSTVDSRTCALCDKISERCDFQRERCILAVPNREIEAWTLADPLAIRAAFGFPADRDLPHIPTKPHHVESLPDPKVTRDDFLKAISAGRRRALARWPYESIAQEQDIARLLSVPSFAVLADATKNALRGLGYPDL